jgi:uncharacterized protein (TIGR03435 family)
MPQPTSDHRVAAVALSFVAVIALTALALPAGAQATSDRKFLTVSVKEGEISAVQRLEPRLRNGQFSWQGVPLKWLIQYAYDRQGVAIDGAVPAVFYDVVATYPPTAAPRDIQSMVRSLLSDRFSFRGHVQARQVPAFELVIDGSTHRLAVAKIEGGASPAGTMRGLSYPERTTLTGLGVTPRQIANALADRVVKRPVIDKTGITDVFDIDLVYARGDEKSPDPGLAPIATAVRNQLGLQLKEVVSSVQFLVVDRIEAR